MSDGPFRHLRLSTHWKRLVAAACNDAVDQFERCGLAKDALTREILTDENSALLREIRAYARCGQLDMDPNSPVDTIFGSHPKTAFGDILQSQMAFRVADHMTPDVALDRALEASVHEHTAKAKSRILDECIRALECGELTQDQYDRMVAHVNATFDALTETDICDALSAGDRNAFKADASKRTGLDEGPKL